MAYDIHGTRPLQTGTLRGYARLLMTVDSRMTANELRLCAEDLAAMFHEEYDGDDPSVDTFVHADNFAGCWQEWCRRIGGVRNVGAYARTLVAGAARKEQEARHAR